MLAFAAPVEGAIIHTAGQEEGFVTPILKGGHAPVWVNGILCSPIENEDKTFTVQVPIPLGTHLLKAQDATGQEAILPITRVHTSTPLYRVSVDDGIWFLQDIFRHASAYHSIFNNPFLGLFRKLHLEYGIKVHINIYLTCPEEGGFHLSQFPGKYQKEWAQNRHWLRLSFHGKANTPDYPYIHSDYNTLYQDCSQVMKEIHRFTGNREAVTTLHFADTTPLGIKALYDCGIRALLGDFAYNSQGEEALGYQLPKKAFSWVRNKSFWQDPISRMIFFPCDVVLDTLPPKDIPPALDQMATAWPGRNFIDILIHEQYFYPDYPLYEKDYEDRIRAGITWCQDRGYAPGFVSNVLGDLLT